jgi:predicted ester cyclase
MRNLWLGGVLFLAVTACGGEEAPANPPPTTMTSASATPPPVTSASAAATTPAPAPKPPLADLIKKTMAEEDAAWAAHDAAKVVAGYAPDATFAMPGPMGWHEQKRDEMQKDLDNLFKAFPDLKVTSTRVFMKGNMVVVEGVMTGTNSGEFMGEKATGKKIGHRSAMVMWFNDDGLITKEHAYHDHATMMGHLGHGMPGMKMRAVEAIPTVTVEQVASGDNAVEAKNDAAAKALYGAFEKKDNKAFTGAFADDTTLADYTRHEDLKGKDVAKKWWTEMYKSFPDLKVSATDSMAIGEYVISEIEVAGTFKADFQGMKANNKAGTVHELNVLKFNKDGKIVWSGIWGSRAEFANAFGLPMPGHKPGAAAAPAGAGKEKGKDKGKEKKK